jgi:hypothetical protein
MDEGEGVGGGVLDLRFGCRRRSDIHRHRPLTTHAPVLVSMLIDIDSISCWSLVQHPAQPCLHTCFPTSFVVASPGLESLGCGGCGIRRP